MPEIQQEFETIQLGDERLNERSRTLLARLSAHPQQSINAACRGWQESKAAYRLFDNANVEPEQILAAHADATVGRMRQQPVVCIAQDTTELDFSAHPPEDVGCLNLEQRRGLYDHSSVAFTPDKLCLGVVAAEFFDRSSETLGQADSRQSSPIEMKESFRWLEGYRRCCELAVQCPDTQIVSLADREGDIYDIFLEAAQHPTPAEWIIRSRVHRSLPVKDASRGPDGYRQMRDEVAESQVLTRRQIQLPATLKRAARTATLEIRSRRLTVKPPHARSHLPTVTFSVVLVTEVDGPQDGTDLDWLLLSSLPVDTEADTLQIVDLYVARWPIEVYFRVFKTGCRVEQIQLETTTRLQRALMFYKVIAWRIMYLTFLGRECPELPCDVVFSQAEWQSVWKIVEQQEPPHAPPTLAEFIPVLAELGGYNRRRQDRPPGTEAIWGAVRRMFDFALAWESFRPARANAP